MPATASSSCDSVCLGLVISLVLIVVIVVVVVIVIVVVRKKRRRQPAQRRSVGPHVSVIGVVPPEKGEYEYINPIPVNSTDSMPSNSIRLPATISPNNIDSQYLTVNPVGQNAPRENEQYV